MTDKTDTTPDGVDEAVALFESEEGDNPPPPAETKPRKTADDEGEGDSVGDDEAGDEPEKASADESEDDDGEVDAEKEASAKLGRRVQKRIDQLTRKANDREREGNFYKTQAEQERQRAADLERELAWMRRNGGDQHQPQDEQDDATQQRGLTPQQVEAIIARRADEVAAQKEFVAGLTTLQGKLRDGAPEAMERLGNKALTPFENEALEALIEASHPVQVAKALASNDELFNRFSRLPSGSARARLIARLDGSIDARQQAAKNKPAQQVKPTPKVKGVTRAPEKDPNKMSQAEYEDWSRKQGW